MKIVFRTYTKKDGSPENGYYEILQYLEGLKEKNVLVRIDIDKKNVLGTNEVDIFCPSLKISHLNLKKIEGSKFEATFDTKNLKEIFHVLLTLGKTGNGGHSYELLIGDKSFYIDGDGSDYLESINGVSVHNIKEDNRYDWPKIYQEPKESIVMSESEFKKLLSESLEQILKNHISD